MSEIHLKLMVVQKMPASSPGSLLLLHHYITLKSSNGSKSKPFPVCAGIKVLVCLSVSILAGPWAAKTGERRERGCA